MKKKLYKLIVTTTILITILLINVFFWGTNSSYYSKLQRDLAISSNTGMASQHNLEIINRRLTNYLKLKQDDLNFTIKIDGEEVGVFNQKEMLHMEDVKFLFVLMYFIIGIGFLTLAIVIVHHLKNRNIKIIYQDFRRSLITACIISLIVLLLFLTDFELFWDYLHRILFNNDLYLLNPETDFLIQMMPIDFFIAMSTRIVVSFFITHVFSMALLKIGVIYNDKGNRS